MRRREFLRLSMLTPLAFACLPPGGKAAGSGLPASLPNDGRPHRFELSERQFLLDDRPFQIRSGEMHPIRIPSAYWRQRIRMAKAMGLDTISCI